jgi:pyridoxal phosphate enzyme (YggS family)
VTIDVPSSGTVAANVDRVRDRIAGAGGDPDRVRLVAVTKGFGPEVARAAIDAGLEDLGENYAQELVAKAGELGAAAGGVRWHFLGRLQTNKVRHVAPVVTLWQSVDRPELVREIAKRAPGASILVQINLSGEAQKGGCELDEVPALVGVARDSGLDVQGFMGVGPAGPAAAAQPGFESLVSLADAFELPERSIGMSADLEVAVRCGATMVRVGRDLFGARPPRPA